MPLVMNRHLVLQLPLAMLYATFYTYGFDAGSWSRIEYTATGFAATYAPRYTVSADA